MCVCVHQDTCEGCCVGEVNSGYMWKDTPIQSSSLVSCASIHPSFNAKSYAARLCTASPAGLWGAVSVSGCAFIDKADMAIVVMEADVNLMYVQESGQTITEAVMNEVSQHNTVKPQFFTLVALTRVMLVLMHIVQMYEHRVITDVQYCCSCGVMCCGVT